MAGCKLRRGGASRGAMGRFEYLIGLISLVVGLGLTDLAVSLDRLIKQRDRVKWEGLTLTTAGFAAFTLVWIWYNVWSLKSFEGFSGFWFYLTLLAEMLLLFLGSAASLPDAEELGAGEGLNLRAYYQDNKAYIWTLFALFHSSYLLRWLYFLSIAHKPLTLRVVAYGAMDAAPVVLCVALAFARPRAVQWALLAALIGLRATTVWGMSL